MANQPPLYNNYFTGTYVSQVSLTNGTFQNPATVTSTGKITVSFSTIGSYAALYGNNASGWNVTNLGTVVDSGSNSFGINLVPTLPTTVVNGSRGDTTALVSGTRQGINIQNAAGAITNYGTVNQVGAAGYAGVELIQGGSVSNSGVITSQGNNGQGIAAGGTIVSSVTNSGTITASGSSGAGVLFTDGGSLSNTGTITGTDGGVFFFGTSPQTNTLINYGAIAQTGASGSHAVDSATVATVRNSGTITGQSTSAGGVYLEEGGGITNTGLISGQVAGVRLNDIGTGGTGTVVNTGTISSSGTNGSAVSIGTAISVSVVNGLNGSTAGVITGYHLGIFANTAGAPSTILNYGTIQSTQLGTVAATGFFGVGIALQSGGTVTNFGQIAVAETSGAGSGVVIQNAAGSVANYGTIFSPVSPNATSGSGVYLGAGGNVTNGSTSVTTALIDGGHNGVFLETAGTVSNFGTIESNSTVITSGSLHGPAVLLEHGGLFVNGTAGSTSALVESPELSVYAGGISDTPNGTAATVVNFGTIEMTGTGTYGSSAVDLASGGTITNFGTILRVGGGGTSGEAVSLGAGGTVINYGMITGSRFGTSGSYPGAINANNAPATVRNFGTITNPDTSNGVNLLDGGIVINGSSADTTATIDVTRQGVYMGGTSGVPTTGAVGTLVNYGTIESTTSLSSAVSMVSGGTETNFGLVLSPRTGLAFSKNSGTVLNYGTVMSTAPLSGTVGVGIYLGAGGTIINGVGAIDYALRSAIGIGNTFATSAAVYIRNQGTLIGSSGVTVQPVDTGNTTVVNFGTITGTSGTAVYLGSGSNLVMVEPGAVFNGIVNGGTGGDSTLEFVSGVSISTTLGGQYTNFAIIDVDPGANLTLSGANTVTSGSTLDVSGTLTVADSLTVAGLLTNSGSIVDPMTISGTLANTGTITGTGVTLLTGAYLDNAAGGVISASTAVLGLYGPSSIVNAGTISGTTGPGIDLTAGGSVTNASTATIVGSTAGIAVSGPAVIANYGTITGANGTAVAFNGTGEVLVEGSGAVLNGSVSNFRPGDVIDLKGIVANGSSFVTGSGGGGGGSIVNGSFSTGDFTGWTEFTTGTNGSLAPSGSNLPAVTSFNVTGAGTETAATFQVGELTFDGTQQGGGLQQTVDFTGGEVSFSAAIAATVGVDNESAGVFSVLLDGTVENTVNLGSIAGYGTITGALSFSAYVSAGAHTLAVEITRPYLNDSTTPEEFITNISLSGGGSVLELTNNGTAVGSIGISAPPAGYQFVLTPDGSGGTDITLAPVAPAPGRYMNGIVLDNPATQNPTTLSANFYVTNQTAAYNGDAVFGTGAAAWNLTNQGTIKATGTAGAGSDGIYFVAGGSVNNSGYIADTRRGVAIVGAPGSVVNSGSIVNGATGIYLAAGGVITNAAGGVISSGSYGIALGGATVTTAGATVTNFGSITGNVGIGISPLDTGSNTIINYGAITGTGGVAASFGGDPGTLVVEPGATFNGAIADFTAGDTIDFAGVAAATNASYANGVLTLFDGSVAVASIAISGAFVPGQFSLTPDGHGGFSIGVISGPPVRSALTGLGLTDTLMSSSTNGSVFLDQVADGTMTFTQIGGLGREWQFEGAGAFLNDGRQGFLLWNATNGSIFVGEDVGGVAQYTQIGGVGGEWLFEGTGAFLGQPTTDFLLYNDIDNGLYVASVVGGAAQFTQIGGLGPEWQFTGTGDYLGDGRTAFMMRDLADGSLFVGEDVAGTAVYTQIGGLGSEWQFEGSGDLLGHNQDDFLIRNANNGSLFVGEVSDGTAQYTQIGGVGPEWEFLGVGDYDGKSQSEILMRNSLTGSLVIGTVSNDNLTYATVGGVGPEWNFHINHVATVA